MFVNKMLQKLTPIASTAQASLHLKVLTNNVASFMENLDNFR